MILKDIINKSYYGSVGYISNLEDINRLEQYIIYNLPVLKEFINIITSTTYINDDSELRVQLENTWKKYFPNSIHLDKGISRGHNLGAADNDYNIGQYCKNNSISWICKSANDMIFDLDILNIIIKEADFYYLIGIGYGGIQDYKFNISFIMEDLFYPQTNFYFMNMDKVDYINDMNFLEESFNYASSQPRFNGRVFDYVDGTQCEQLLRSTIYRNKLVYHHLLNNKTYEQLLSSIQKYQISDGSHKNIMVDGICHFHFPKENILQINNINK